METLLFCFSNSQNSPLATLTEEEKGLFAKLSPRSARGHYNIQRESFAETETVIRQLETFQSSICLFHFAGHAGSEGILLDDKWGRVEGLAALLARCQNLKFVFLNGCATKQLVDAIRAKNPKVGILATQTAIDDKQASKLSVFLYDALVNQYSLGEAIEKAKEKLSFSADFNFTKRGSGEDTAELGANNWVFISPDPSVELWSLPTSSLQQRTNYIPNKQLIIDTFSALNAHEPTLKDRLDNESGGIDDPVIIDRVRSKLIIESLSYPLAEPLRRILCPPTQDPADTTPKPTKNRIHAYQNLFDSVISLLVGTLLSQVRDLYMQLPKDQVKITDVQIQIFKSYLLGDRTISFDLILQNLREVLAANTTPHYVEELDELVKHYYDANSTLASSIQFFVDLKARFPYAGMQVLSDADCANICEIGEENLSDIARNSGFWVRYNLESYKNVRVIRYFSKAPQYKHEKVRLKASLLESKFDTSSFYREDKLSSPVLLESQSVLLVKNIPQENAVAYLSLAPFILDRNFFNKKSDNVFDLHIFERYNKENKTLEFRRIGRPEDPLLVIQTAENDRQTDADFGVLREQFNLFVMNMFNVNYWEL